MTEWLNFSGLVIAAAIAGFAGYKSSRAERNSRPVANGFTLLVLENFKEIRAALDRHIEDHAAK